MNMVFRAFIVAAGLAWSAGVRADDPAPEPSAPPPITSAIIDYGRDNPDCMEWTDACHICLRDANGVPQCSTPAIACVLEAPVCRTRKGP